MKVQKLRKFMDWLKFIDVLIADQRETEHIAIGIPNFNFFRDRTFQILSNQSRFLAQ